jgi:enamine deaminase RidA (YjgF/YER057c/UK114 family)
MPSMLNRIPGKLGFALLLAVCAMGADQQTEKKVVAPKDSPAGRPFSPGILVRDTLYVSGQGGFDPKIQKIPDNFDDEVRRA